MNFIGDTNITAFRVASELLAPVTHLEWKGGFNETYLQIELQNQQYEHSARFSVRIYTESANRPNDFVYGEHDRNSREFFQYRIFESDLVQDTFTVATSSWLVTQVLLNDNTSGYGGVVDRVKVDELNQRVIVHFIRRRFRISFTLTVFGKRE